MNRRCASLASLASIAAVGFHIGRTGILSRAIGLAIVYGGLLWSGYQRRIGTWTQRSWILFGVCLLGGFAMVALSLTMATGVDNGVYDGMSHGAREAYFATMTAMMIGGIVASATLIIWFAKGNPRRQFGFIAAHKSDTRTLLQADVRDRLHQALVARGFSLVAERDDPASYGSWERDYVRGDDRARINWDSEGWLFRLAGGKELHTLATRNPGQLAGNGLDEFLSHLSTG